MDKFDLQISMLKPESDSARLKERQFMQKLTKARHARQTRRILLGVMVLAVLLVIIGALRRNVLDVLVLTFRYFTELPSMFSEYTNAYISAISWPSVASTALLVCLAVLLVRTRKDIMAANSQRTYKYAMITGAFALAFALVGLFGSSTHAAAQQEALRRKLNDRGHLEVRVNGSDYELYAQSGASDDSIRNQALIEQIKNFDISKAYPKLKDMSRDGWVAEVRAVNTEDDCIFYVERRLEPALKGVIDANSGCIRHNQAPTYYLDERLQPVKEPKWKTGQTMYMSWAKEKTPTPDPGNPFAGHVEIVVLLPGKADDYVAQQLGDKLVPKGQPSTGVRECGIDFKETCPATPYIDVFTNAQGYMASGEIGSSVPGDSLRPQAGSNQTEFFGKIVTLDDKALQLQTISGQKVVISWPRNIIQEFNAHGALNYPTASGKLAIQTGDSLIVRIYYKDGMNLERLAISDVWFIGLALKPVGPDPLKNETYSKEKAMLTEKY